MRLASLVSLALLAGVAACGSSGSSYTTAPGSGSGSGPGSHTMSVSMSGSAFSPSLDSVTAGSVVTWTNDDGFAHNVTSAPGSAVYGSGDFGMGGTFQHTFSTPGTYVYYCTIHGTPTTGMHATIVVQ